MAAAHSTKWPEQAPSTSRGAAWKWKSARIEKMSKSKSNTVDPDDIISTLAPIPPAGSCCRTRRPSATSSGPRKACRARRNSSSACGASSANWSLLAAPEGTPIPDSLSAEADWICAGRFTEVSSKSRRISSVCASTAPSRKFMISRTSSRRQSARSRAKMSRRTCARCSARPPKSWC